MSSSNLVSVTYVAEATYGTAPTPAPAVALKTARFTSESLSGTPETTVSQELRTDRMSSGQVVTGLAVDGDISFELSRDAFFDDFFEASLMTTYVAKLTSSAGNITLTPITDQSATLTLTGALTGAAVGDILQLDPTAGGSPTVLVVITSITTPTTVFVVATARNQAAMAAVPGLVYRPAYAIIGATKKSFTISKAYQDVTHLVSSDQHSQTYNGELVSGFSIDAAYGAIVTGSFTMAGNGYTQVAPSYAQTVVTAGGSVTAAGTSSPLNASVDMPVVTKDGYVATDFCVEKISLTMSNGLDPQNCIGKVAPQDYSLGTCEIGISVDAYLSDSSYDSFMAKKLSQVPINLTFSAFNSSGGYAFAISAAQLSFPDPSATGLNEQVMINATGTAKVGTGGASSIRIYKLDP
jgi:Phage tail tube protein